MYVPFFFKVVATHKYFIFTSNLGDFLPEWVVQPPTRNPTRNHELETTMGIIISQGLVQPPTGFGWCWAWCHIFMTPPRLRYLEARRTENPGLGGESRLVVWRDFSCGDARSGVFFLYFCIMSVCIYHEIVYCTVF